MNPTVEDVEVEQLDTVAGPGPEMRVAARATRAAATPRILVRPLVLVVVTTLAAWAVSTLRSPVYGGVVDIRISTRGYESEAASTRLLSTQKVILQSERVLGPIAQEEGMSYSRLAERTSVRIVGQTEILRVTVADRSRNRARSLAQAVADSYVGSASDLAVVSPARSLSQPLRPRPLRAAAGGFLVGLFLASGMILLWWARRRRPWDSWL